MCLQTFHGVEKTPLFYYNNQHQEKRFGGSKKGIRFSKKFFETHRKPHGYWVPVISVTKDNAKRSLSLYRNRLLLFFLIKCTRNCVYCLVILPLRYNKQSYWRELAMGNIATNNPIYKRFKPGNPAIHGCLIKKKWRKKKTS